MDLVVDTSNERLSAIRTPRDRRRRHAPIPKFHHRMLTLDVAIPHPDHSIVSSTDEQLPAALAVAVDRIDDAVVGEVASFAHARCQVRQADRAVRRGRVEERVKSRELEVEDRRLVRVGEEGSVGVRGVCSPQGCDREGRVQCQFDSKV